MGRPKFDFHTGTGKLTARERKLLKKYGGDIDAMREAEQRRIGSRTREGRRAPSPEPLPIDEEEEVRLLVWAEDWLLSWVSLTLLLGLLS